MSDITDPIVGGVIYNERDGDFYENMTYTRNPQYDSIMSALDIVKHFIKVNNLILVGGMAIDWALRLKGDSIYGDDQLPDYDFYSPTHTKHAYEIGELLCKKGYPNISCIPAMHLTTMRVRIDMEAVADISFCPQSVFDNVPTLVYDGIRIVHPHFQMIDQHSSLGLPFENPGREVIFHRWRKDMVRYDKLYKHYPITDTAQLSPPPDSTGLTLAIDDPKYQTLTSDRQKRVREYEIKIVEHRVHLKYLKGSCITGWGAIDYKIDGDHIVMNIPAGEPLSIQSDDYESYLKEHKLIDVQYYSEYFGKTPRKILARFPNPTKDSPDHIEIYDTYGLKVSAEVVHQSLDVYMGNIQWVMMFLIVRMFDQSTIALQTTAEGQYLRCRQLVKDGRIPSISVYGRANFSPSFVNTRKIHKERTYNIKAPALQPGRMYPKKPNCINDKTFDTEASWYFFIDSRKLDKFESMALDPYPHYNRSSTRGVNPTAPTPKPDDL
jgi:hypothetical protein